MYLYHLEYFYRNIFSKKLVVAAENVEVGRKISQTNVIFGEFEVRTYVIFNFFIVSNNHSRVYEFTNNSSVQCRTSTV